MLTRVNIIWLDRLARRCFPNRIVYFTFRRGRVIVNVDGNYGNYISELSDFVSKVEEKGFKTKVNKQRFVTEIEVWREEQ